MFKNDSDWLVFGYDFRLIGAHWKSAWREVFWAHDSPLRSSMEESVRLRVADGEKTVRLGSLVNDRSTRFTGHVVPDDHVLLRKLTIPASVRGDIQDAVNFEVSLSSPFESADTSYGWRVMDGGAEEELVVELAIVSTSSTIAYLSRVDSKEAASDSEVWVEGDGGWIMIGGFGEAARLRAYRSRVLKSAILALVVSALLVATVAVPTVSKKLELGRIQARLSVAEAEAAQGLELRDRLTTLVEAAQVVRNGVSTYPSVHAEIAYLTSILDDSVYLERLNISGRRVTIRGKATNASEVMNVIAESERYSDLLALQAISRVGKSNLEQFQLAFTIAGSPGVE